MLSQTSSNSVKFKEFMNVVRDSKFPVLFEGEDVKYYDVRLNQYLDKKDWVHIDCNGKENLLKLRDEIKNHSQYKDVKALYFIDADFDDNTHLLQENDIYITPCYAIENFYISDNAFENILIKQFKISPYSEDKNLFVEILKSYKKSKSDFLSAIEELNKYFYALKNKMDKNNTISFKDIKFNKVVDVGLTTTTKKYAYIKEVLPQLDETSIDLSKAEEYFRDKNKERSFRGKNLIEFFKTYLIKLKEEKMRSDISDEKRIFFKKKGKINFTITDNILSEICIYADTPECLKNFLKRHND